MTEGSLSNTTMGILLVVTTIVLISVLTGGGMMGGAGMVGGMMFLWPILLIVIIVVLVWVSETERKTGDRDHAMTVLRERYARGELSKEEFEKRKRRLRSKD